MPSPQSSRTEPDSQIRKGSTSITAWLTSSRRRASNRSLRCTAGISLRALQDKYGGWQSAETAKAFGDYGGFMAKHLSDRVRHFFTNNEFKQVTETAFRGVELHVRGKTVRLMGFRS